MLGSKTQVVWCKPSGPISEQPAFTTSQEAIPLSQHGACRERVKSSALGQNG